MESTPATPSPAPAQSGCGKPVIILLGLLLLVVAGVWLYLRWNLNAKPFKPVNLTAPEQKVFDGKVEWAQALSEGKPLQSPPDAVEKEDLDSRRFVLTEKEVNSLISTRPEAQEYSDKLRIDFRNGAVALSANMPVPVGVPVMGGRNVRVAARAKLGLSGGKLTLVIDSATIGGIEMPSAWTEGWKGRDLGAELEAKADPVVKKFLAGIDSVQVLDDRLEIRLKE